MLPARDQDEILSVENLSVALGGTTVLKDVRFSVRQGEALAVLGPNGAARPSSAALSLDLIQARARSAGAKARRSGTFLRNSSSTAPCLSPGLNFFCSNRGISGGRPGNSCAR